MDRRIKKVEYHQHRGGVLKNEKETRALVGGVQKRTKKRTLRNTT